LLKLLENPGYDIHALLVELGMLSFVNGLGSFIDRKGSKQDACNRHAQGRQKDLSGKAHGNIKADLFGGRQIKARLSTGLFNEF
jgi:hypothetical protein